ncbi:lysophospholipid acyltransferase family protein [Cellulomonas alba]|uniref:Lysophospholipid acyltransferase family protein n=1 Tax=Cellulomonas alba TaxID=3053467 RepID=A0ABT7SBN9_9CELL|nr:lysophospholipid acyltransferase family protein [Cellulomonas alba]MDM7853596.1 lysophospholipid acyltransferase family protein [Cellulomonas alba]
MFYWLMKRVFVGPLLHLVYRPWVRGAEHVPASGGAILASNHLAVIDSFFLPLVLDRELVFIGKQEYFTGSGVKGRMTAGFMRGVGTIPVDRGGGKASEAALRTGLRRLEEGGLFGIYPEGTRSPDGRLYRGKTGIARLALESGAPVVPIAMVGTDVAQPIGRRIPKVMRIGVVIGEPLDFSRYRGMENDRFILRAVTDEIMYAIMSLSGQEYVDVYAATQKARIAAGHPAAAGEEPGAAAAAPGGRPVPDVQVPVPPQEQDEPSVG